MDRIGMNVFLGMATSTLAGCMEFLDRKGWINRVTFSMGYDRIEYVITKRGLDILKPFTQAS